MEYVTISPPFIHSARPLDNLDFTIYEEAGNQLIELCDTESFSCGIYNQLGATNSSKANSVSLYYHQIEQQSPAAKNAPFAAIFNEQVGTLPDFRHLLRQHLLGMNLIDRQFFDTSFFMIESQDRSEFEFSFGGRIYGVRDYHPRHPLPSQRTESVVLIFTAKHDGEQFYSPISHYSNATS